MPVGIVLGGAVQRIHPDVSIFSVLLDDMRGKDQQKADNSQNQRLCR